MLISLDGTESPQQSGGQHPQLAPEGVFSEEAINAQTAALMALPDYPVTVVRRETTGEPETTLRYEISHEIVHYSDGAVRRLTRARPKEKYFGNNGTSPIPVVGGDALGTGPNGINASIIEKIVTEGFPVEWLHHQGREAAWPTTPAKARRLAHFLLGKSVGRSAHHAHALLDDLAQNGGVEYDTSHVIGVGDSRQAMTGEAMDALAIHHDREVIWGDYFAACFHHRPTLKEALALPFVPLKEAISLGKLTISTLHDDFRTGAFDHPRQMLGTLDLHPMNVIHELAWIVPLLNGDAGKYAAAVPLHSHGVRTLFRDDAMSQHASWQITHADRPSIRFQVLPGTHLDLARPENQSLRTERLERLLTAMREHNFDLENLDYRQVYEPQEDDLAA